MVLVMKAFLAIQTVWLRFRIDFCCLETYGYGYEAVFFNSNFFVQFLKKLLLLSRNKLYCVTSLLLHEVYIRLYPCPTILMYHF